MRKHPWLRGKAMHVALTLRGFMPGDEVIPKGSAQPPDTGYDKQFIGRVCVVELPARSLSGLDTPEYASWWLVRHRSGPGMWITEDTIKAWRPKHS